MRQSSSGEADARRGGVRKSMTVSLFLTPPLNEAPKLVMLDTPVGARLCVHSSEVVQRDGAVDVGSSALLDRGQGFVRPSETCMRRKFQAFAGSK